MTIYAASVGLARRLVKPLLPAAQALQPDLIKVEAPALPTTNAMIMAGYRPQRLLELRLQKYKGYEKWAYAILVIGLLTSAWLLGMTLTLVIGFYFSCAFAACFMFRSWIPQWIGFDEEGISFVCAAKPNTKQYRPAQITRLPWSDLSNAYLHLKPGGKRFIRFAGDKEKIRLALIKSGGHRFWNQRDQSIELKIDAFDPQERRQVLAALTRALGVDNVDKPLKDALNPVNPATYTALWMESLHSQPVRQKEELLELGTILANGRYRVQGIIGAGGQGTVYEAIESSATDNVCQEHRVVLKEFVLPSTGGLEVTSRALDNVGREAKLLQSLNHDQIVHLRDYFVEDHRAYLVLEYIDGLSLKSLVELHGKMDESVVRQLSGQICDILAYLHGQSPPVIHRDLTPENLLLSSDGKLKLIDFNVALQLESQITRTIVGKHSYIPPEQFRGKATIQSDIYAAGATIFFLLTGEDPEPITTSYPQNLNDEVSDSLNAIVARATNCDAGQRYADIAEVARDLAQQTI